MCMSNMSFKRIACAEARHHPKAEGNPQSVLAPKVKRLEWASTFPNPEEWKNKQGFAPRFALLYLQADKSRLLSAPLLQV